ncbi:MAG: hypothetical protein WC728_11510 [Elusimicrobiota bacterium]
MSPSEDGEFVGSGSFRVDSSRMLEKLSRFQLDDPSRYALSWVRFAIASGASRIHISSRARSVEMRFDGRPLSRKQLAHPYECLFDETTDAEVRARHLAVGLLSAFRLSPSAVTLTSGSGPGRLALRAEAPGKDSVSAGRDPGPDTVLRVEWPLLMPKGVSIKGQLNHVRHSGCWLCTIPVMVDGTEAQRYQDSWAILPFSENGIRGYLSPSPRNKESHLRIYVWSIRVCGVDVRLPWAQISGDFNCDRLQLDASHSGVVRDAVFEEALAEVSRQAERMLLELCSLQKRSFPEFNRLLLDRIRPDYWKRYFREGELWAPVWMEELPRVLHLTAVPVLGDWLRAAMERLQRVNREAYRTRWLREAVLSLQAPSGDGAESSLKKALWDTPLYLGTDGNPLSMNELETRLPERGRLPIGYGPRTPGGGHAVWCASGEDRESLSAVFGETALDPASRPDG